MRPFSIDFEAYSEQAILSAFLKAAKAHQASIIIWCEPGQKSVCLLLNFSKALSCGITGNQSAGFIFSPFITEDKHSFFLQAELLYFLDNKQLVEKNNLNPAKTKDFLSTVNEYLSSNSPVDYFISFCAKTQNSEFKDCFINLVEKGLDEIKHDALQKVVLARTKTIALPQEFNLLEIFQKLRQFYPQQFISLISTAEFGSWLGCSPELLLSVNGREIETTALAGTKLKDQAWTTKEYHEQALVTEFIRQQLRQLDVDHYRQTRSSSYSLGAFKHLKTQFKITLDSELAVRPFSARLLNVLHPTSAVCGMPQQNAQAFIQQYEDFDRQLYCGYLGPCNIQTGQTQIYVNIRCMQLFEQQAVLYAGAGITQYSDPIKEWEETNLKCQTLLDFI